MTAAHTNSSHSEGTASGGTAPDGRHTVLELPQLSGGRRRAAALVDGAHLPGDLTDATITVDARQLLAGTESFADELVKVILLDRRANLLSVINVSDDFAAFLEQAAKTHSVSRRLAVDRF